MFTKVEFILYSDYTPATKTNAELTELAAAIYTDIYDADLSATKTLGLTDYFGNQPRSFDFKLDYDSWIQDNIIAETNDISKWFSKYVIRVYDGENYVFSGVIELSYFKHEVAKNKVNIKAYDWIVTINKIKDLSFKDAGAGGGYFPKPYIDGNPYFGIGANMLEVSSFAASVICVAQSLIFGGFPLREYNLGQIIGLSVIKPYVDIQNIISSREDFQLNDLGFSYNKVSSSTIWHDEGWVLDSNGRAVYTIIFFMRKQTNIDGFTFKYSTYRYNSINIEYQQNVQYGGVYGSDYMSTVIDEINAKFSENTDIASPLLTSSGGLVAHYMHTTVTDQDTNIYTRTIEVTNRAGDQNVYFDIFTYCNYITNGQSITWASGEIGISSALKVASIAGNGAFCITEDNPDEIKFISKYLDDPETDFVEIADDDIIDDLEFARVPKQGISIEDLRNVMAESNAIFLIGKFQTFYDQFFLQINKSARFTYSNIFNNYSTKTTDKIVVTGQAQVINSHKKESEAFVKIESMNYLMDYWIDENGDFIIDESGNKIVFPAF